MFMGCSACVTVVTGADTCQVGRLQQAHRSLALLASSSYEGAATRAVSLQTTFSTSLHWLKGFSCYIKQRCLTGGPSGSLFHQLLAPCTFEEGIYFMVSLVTEAPKECTPRPLLKRQGNIRAWLSALFKLLPTHPGYPAALTVA